jgi:hypothetical protein
MADSNDREVDRIVRTLRARGSIHRSELSRTGGADQTGFGRATESPMSAERAGDARRVARARHEAAAQRQQQDLKPPAG